MKQPTLFDTLPAVGDVLYQLYRTTGYRMRPVRVLSVDPVSETFVCGPLRHSDTSRFTLDSSLVKPVPKETSMNLSKSQLEALHSISVDSWSVVAGRTLASLKQRGLIVQVESGKHALTDLANEMSEKATRK